MSRHTVVITPYFEDVACQQFCAELSHSLKDNDYVIVIDDGSIAHVFDADTLRTNSINGCVLRLRRNVGHQTAIATGISYAVEHLEFEQLVVMDSDGEDSPSDIDSLVEKLGLKDIDVVVATRKSRVETKKFKLFYFLYRQLFRLLVGRTIAFGNFMVFTENAAKRLSNSNETRIHLAASVLNSKLRILAFPVDRGSRYAGKSKMNMVSLLLHGLRSIMVFAESVLVRITMFSAVCAAAIVATMLVMILIKLTGFAIPGWFSTVGGILLLLLFQVAIMALLVLLLAGNLRSESIERFNYKELIDEVIRV